ncbi:MAG: glycosyltransferase [Parvularculaceae bacterium]
MSAAQPLLYLDFETGFVGHADDVGFERFSERHYAEFRVERADSAHTPYTAYSEVMRPVTIALHNGLPTREELAFSARVLADNRKLYYHWPAEKVVEVVTHERFGSFRRHVRFVSAYWGWREFHRGLSVGVADLRLRVRSNVGRLRRLLRRALTPASASNASLAGSPAPASGARATGTLEGPPRPERFAFLQDGPRGFVASGRGLYFRLDYWVKLNSGGSYGHTVYQAKALNKVSTESLICVMTSRYELLDDVGVAQLAVPSPNALADEFALVSNGAAYGNLALELLKFYRPAYVFERIVLGSSAVARACVELDIPYIAEFNGSELTMSKVFGGVEKQNAAQLQEIELESMRAADVVSVVSEAVKDEIVALGISSAKVLVNPNCVDFEAYKPLPQDEREKLRASFGFRPDDVVLGFCGTFGGWHGVDVLAAAMPKILAERPGAGFLLIGDGVLKHLVTGIAETSSGRVCDLGRLSQAAAARALAACDIFLSPHSSNMGDKPFFGSPTKLFEYMAYGAGIVCSDLEQLGEVMRPALKAADAGSAGPPDARCILVNPGSVDDLVAAALRLIDDRDLRDRLGRNARAAAARYYTWDVHVQSLWRFAKGLPPVGYLADRSGK